MTSIISSISNKIFLIRNIMEITGIHLVQDLILSFALLDEYYMEKAREHARYFYPVNSLIKVAISRNNWPKYYFTENTFNFELNSKEQNNDGECWQFAVPIIFIGNEHLHKKSYIVNKRVDISELTEKLIMGLNCPKCGEYLVHNSLSRLSVCTCDMIPINDWDSNIDTD